MRKPPKQLKPANPISPGYAIKPAEMTEASNWKPAVEKFMSGGLNLERKPMTEIGYNAGTMADYSTPRATRMGPSVNGAVFPIPNERMFPDRFGVNQMKKAFFERPELVAKVYGNTASPSANAYTAAEVEAERSVRFTDTKQGVLKSPTPSGATPDEVFSTLGNELKRMFGYAPEEVASQQASLQDIINAQAPQRQMAGLPDPNSLPGAFAIGQALAALLRGDGLGSAAEAYAQPMALEQGRLDQQYALNTEQHKSAIDAALKQLGYLGDVQSEMSRYSQSRLDNASRETIATSRNAATIEAQRIREQGLNEREKSMMRRKDVSGLLDILANTVEPSQRAIVISNINAVYGSDLLDPKLAYVQDPGIIKKQYDAVRSRIISENEQENQRVEQDLKIAQKYYANAQARFMKERTRLLPLELEQRSRRLDQFDRMIGISLSRLRSDNSFESYKAISEFLNSGSQDSVIGFLEDEYDDAASRAKEARVAFDAVSENINSKQSDRDAAKARYEEAQQEADKVYAELRDARTKRRSEGAMSRPHPKDPAYNPTFFGPPGPGSPVVPGVPTGGDPYKGDIGR